MDSRAHPGSNVTGVYKKLYVAQSLKVMAQVVPGLRGGKAGMITDFSPTGNGLTKQFELELADMTEVKWEVRRVARALDVFRHHVTDLWRRTLRRRSQKDGITWARMTKLVDDWLPKPIILHPWPSDRFAVTHPRWEPYAGKPHVRIYAGGVR